MKRNLYFLIMILAFVSIFSACSSTSNEKESGKETTNTTNENQEEETQASDSNPEFLFKASSQAPPQSAFSKGFDAYLDAIEEKSEGRIKFERYYSESLAKAADHLDALSTKIADIAVFVPSYIPSKIPLATVGTNPALWKNSWVGARSVNDLYQTSPELNKELEQHNVKFVGQYALPSYYILTTKKVESIADLEGLKMIATGQNAVLAKELGAVPVSIPITESFDALQRGTVDGVFFGLTAATTYSLEEVVKYVYMLPIGSSSGLIGMNFEKYNDLPNDLKNIFEETSKTHAKDYHKIYQINGDKEAMKKLKDAGAKFITASEKDIKKLKSIAKESIWSNWVEKNGGKKAQEILDQLVENIEKYKNQNPYKE